MYDNINMKVANTRKVNERIMQYMEREQLNSLIGMGLSGPVSIDEIVFKISITQQTIYSYRGCGVSDKPHLRYTDRQLCVAAV